MKKKQFDKSDLLMTLLKGRTFIVLVVLAVLFSVIADNFLSVSTLTMVAKHVALYGILAIGMTYVIITGGIDLSVGSVVGLSGMIAGGLIQEGLTIGGYTAYFSVPAIVLIVLIMGCLIGLLNGLIVTKLNVAPFIATMGTMYICRGLGNIRSGGNTFSSLAGFEGLGNTGFKTIGSSVMGIPVAAILFLILAVITAIVLRKTTFGWHVYAVGGNERAALMSGVKTVRVKTCVYILSGACSALVGMINTAQLMAAHPASGTGWEMNAITAAVLGGTSMAGGIGTIGGTFVGAFVIGVLNDGMTMCGVSEFWQNVIKGAVIILAVVIDQYQRNLQAKMALRIKNEAK